MQKKNFEIHELFSENIKFFYLDKFGLKTQNSV